VKTPPQRLSQGEGEASAVRLPRAVERLRRGRRYEFRLSGPAGRALQRPRLYRRAIANLENRRDALGVVNTVADPDYVTASASRERLELASEAGSLSFALDAAETIHARDSLEKMPVHQMAVLHRGMMRAAIRMNEEISRLNEQLYHLDEGKREAANVRACRLAGAISRLSATYQQGLLTLQRKRTGGSQHVTVKHIHQQVNVTEGGQAVVAGDTVTGRTRGRRGIAKKGEGEGDRGDRRSA
jgi:hypothetical protein